MSTGIVVVADVDAGKTKATVDTTVAARKRLNWGSLRVYLEKTPRYLPTRVLRERSVVS